MRGEALVFFLENKESLSAFRNASLKILRKLKKQGIIQTFIFGEEISEVKTETQYLLNKIPSLPEVLADFEVSVCVKL